MRNGSNRPAPGASLVQLYPDGVRVTVMGRSAHRRALTLLYALGDIGARVDDRRGPIRIGSRNVVRGYVVPFGLGVDGWSELLPDIVDAIDDAELPGARRLVHLSRLELALDVVGLDADRAARLLVPCIVLDGPPRVPVVNVETTTYWRRGRSGRNVVVYADKPAKLEHDGPRRLHVELRLGGKSLDDVGMRVPRDLLQLSDAWIGARLEKHVILAEVHASQLAHGRDDVTDALGEFHHGPWTVPATAQAVFNMMHRRKLGDPLAAWSRACACARASDMEHTPLEVLGLSIPAFLEAVA